MSHTMFHDHKANSTAVLDVALIEKTEHERAIAEAYAKGRSDVFAFLGLDEKDFPEGDGPMAWAV